MLFEPYKTVAVVGGGESLVDLLLMLEDASAQVASYADVESAAAAGYDVCEIVALFHGERLIDCCGLRG